ncbi:MAG: hypothetical protein ACJA1A_002223 [Saprospiraceae bacterium]|jgi:hypothetical protein
MLANKKKSMFRASIFILLAFISFESISQGSINVQAFNYNSTTRDSMINFPEADHNDYEKILMHYSMRCKDGLVSTTNDRNRGCGEWDYSCNTSIIDTTRVDSLKATHPSHVISGFSDDVFEYSEDPLYTYYLRDIERTQINNITNETSTKIGNGDAIDSYLFSKSTVSKSYILIDKTELIGVNSIGALSLALESPLEDISYLKISLAQTEMSDLSNVIFDQLDFETVYNNHALAGDLESKLFFQDDYSVDNDENVVIEFSYTHYGKSLEISSTATTSSTKSFAYNNNDGYIDFNNSQIEASADQLYDIANEVTVAFWSKNIVHENPTNTTIVYGEDSNNNRQLNVHLPWSNNNVFWDCGNDGTNYDRINKSIDPELLTAQWNHWAFTKNAVAGNMSIFLNGELWHSGTGLTKPIDINDLFIGASKSFNVAYYGGIDDFMLFDRALSSEEILKIMNVRPSPEDAFYLNLKIFYDFDGLGNDIVNDQSLNNAHGLIKTDVTRRQHRGEEIFKGFNLSTIRPDVTLYSGTYDRTNETVTTTDSLVNSPTLIMEYEVVGSDLLKVDEYYFWGGYQVFVYDQNGELFDIYDIETDGLIEIETLTYYQKFPAKFELLSFVTPYGIGLDFGLDGKTWIFDVTDFGPILKGNKRLLMDKGGQWQEDIDIRFEFISGTPTRDVLDIEQVWPLRSNNYGQISTDQRLEPRIVNVAPNVEQMKVRVATTGHGQEGEFIPRLHHVNIDGGAREIEWQVVTECAFNPIYPQGGTWVYDRAGWCPGAPTDLQEHEIKSFVDDQTEFTIDYGVNFATGDSRYIVNVQLTKYGEANFSNDGSLKQIVSPSDYVEYGRLNPICVGPKIIIENNGAETITNMKIKYGVLGKAEEVYDWTGNIEYLKELEIELPHIAPGVFSQGSSFFAELVEVNGGEDEYKQNNKKVSNYEVVPHIPGDIIINMRTNLASNETKWYLKDENGVTIKSRTFGLSSNTNYLDTIPNLNGCFYLEVVDSGQDGISWWANNDGSGFIRMRGAGAGWKTLEPDFGGGFSYAFTTGDIVDVYEIDPVSVDINVYPNPSSGLFNIELQGVKFAQIHVYDQIGRTVISQLNKNLDQNYDEVQFNLSEKVPGIYFVVIQSNKGRTVKKVILE